MGFFKEKLSTSFKACRSSPKLIVVVVTLTILHDHMLLTAVVPILPDYLMKLRHKEMIDSANNFVNTKECCTTIPNGKGLHCNGSNSLCASPSSTVLNKSGGISTGSKSKDTYPLQVKLNGSEPHPKAMPNRWKIGILFSSKTVTQLLASPFLGPLTNRYGYNPPMFVGFCILFFSTLIFALGESYGLLFFARALQGVGSAFSNTCGLGMLASLYQDDKERGFAMAIALGGLSLGTTSGPPYGSLMYILGGKSLPFIVLAVLFLLDGMLQLLVIQPDKVRATEEGPSLKELFRDPYILIAAGAIAVSTTSLALLEPTLPLWMIHTMNAPQWQLGSAFLPSSASYLLCTSIFGPMSHKIGRWLTTWIGMVIVAGCLVAIPFSTQFVHLIAPMCGLGIGVGMVDAAILPHMGYIVDLRHVAVYGSVYAIADMAFCIGYATVPAISGIMLEALSFRWVLVIFAAVTFIYTPLLVFLRNPSGKNEKQSLLSDVSTQYDSYPEK